MFVQYDVTIPDDLFTWFTFARTHADSGHSEKPAEMKNGLDSSKGAGSPTHSPRDTQSRSVFLQMLH